VSVYLDASGIIKRYVAEAGSDLVSAVMTEDHDWISGRHAWVEVWLALGRLLPTDRLGEARDAFVSDWRRMLVVELDERLCRVAGSIGDSVGLRTLDALHLACADRIGARSIPVLTFDVRLASAARSLGFSVIGS
jgi:uncharacterized protein